MVQAIMPDEPLIVAQRPGPKVSNGPHSRIPVHLPFFVPKSNAFATANVSAAGGGQTLDCLGTSRQ